ncbi:MAG: sarcosine oxidase subunit gamma family protein [Sulfitobacter sp.]
MHNPVSALDNASYDAGIAHISELPPQGMITLRGDLSAKPLVKAVSAAVALGLPDRRECLSQADKAVAWMSPDELLLMCAYEDAGSMLATLTAKLGKVHALAVNVSDARAVFEVRGPNAREVMAKVTPVDLAPSVFTTGMFRRSRIAQVNAAFWMTQEDCFRIICFRSVAQYMFDVLSIAAQPGSEVGVFSD